MDFLVNECDTNILIDKCKTQTSELSNYKLEDSLSLILLNFQSIMSKRESFWEMLDNCSPDIVVGCETWLRPSILDNQMKSFHKIIICTVLTVVMALVVYLLEQRYISIVS